MCDENSERKMMAEAEGIDEEKVEEEMIEEEVVQEEVVEEEAVEEEVYEEETKWKQIEEEKKNGNRVRTVTQKVRRMRWMSYRTY